MIPLKDTVPVRTVPVVNYSIMVVNVIVFLYELMLGKGLDKFIMKWGLVPANFFVLLNDEHIELTKMLLPFFSSMFLHAGWLHIIGNMWFLYIFGDNVEDRLGHVKYIFFYVACGLGAGLSQFMLSMNSRVPMVGASGAIAGVLGAYFLLYPRAKVLTLVPIFFFIQIIELPAFIFLLIWFIIQFFSGTASLPAIIKGKEGGGGVAWWAHIGGFLIGMLLIKIFIKKRKPPLISYPTKWEIN